MNIEVPWIDGRTVSAGGSTSVKDLDSGKTIGYLETRQGFDYGNGKRIPSRNISLFDGKYCGSFETHEECVAFAKGVEAVLDHIVRIKVPEKIAP